MNEILMLFIYRLIILLKMESTLEENKNYRNPIFDNNILSKLNENLELLFAKISPTQDELDFSQVCVQELRNLLKWVFNHAGYGDIDMILYGSQANGLMLKGSSDIDVTITLPESHERNVLYNLLRSSMELPDCYKSEIVDFSKPVTFSTSFSEMSCLDITCKKNPALKREV